MNAAPEFFDKPLAALDKTVLARGRALHAMGAVSQFRAARLDQAVVLSGRVADGTDQSFSVYVSLDDQGLDGDCTCQLGRDCEHVAAVVLAAIDVGRQSASASEATREPGPGRKPRLAGNQSMIYLLRLSADGEELSICPSRVSTGKAGEPLVTTPFALSRLEDSRQPDYVQDEDLAILHALADRVGEASDLVWYPLGPASQQLLREMIATGRCHWETVKGPVLSLAEPLIATVDWQLQGSGYQRPVLVTDDDVDGMQLPLLPPWRLNIETGRCRVLTTAAGDDLLAAGPVAPDAVDDMIRRLESAPDEFPKPRRLQMDQLAPREPVPMLELINTEIGTGRRFETVPAARLSFGYGEIELEWDDEFSSRLTSQDQVVMVERDHGFEEACTRRLEEARLAPAHAGSGGDYRPGEGGLWVARQQRGSSAAWIEFQQRLHLLRQGGWLIKVASDFALELIVPDRWYGDLTADRNNPDTFDLDLGVDWQGQRISVLPALLGWVERTPASLLRALMSGGNSVGEITLALDERRVVQMPVERLAATLRGLADFLDSAPKLKGGRLRLPRGRLAELSEAGQLWQLGGDESLVELSRRLAKFDHIETLPAPEGMVVALRPYQCFGLGWLQFLREFGFGGILADDMGLGKTVQTLAHLQAEKRAGRLDRPCLLVAPTSLMFNWRAEARRFAPELKVLMLHGPQRKGLFQWIRDSDLVLTTYPLLPRDIGHLGQHHYHLLILDEAQAIKNPRAQVSRVAREIKASHRLCLTGTPLENHLGELWSLFDFLMPGMLGSQARFRRQFKNPIEREDDTERREVLSCRIRPFFLRRTKAQVAPELPPKTEITRAVSLEGGQLRLYERARVALHDKVRRALDNRGAERSRIVILDALLKLRQICCDPRLLKVEGKEVEGSAGAGSAKLELLMDLLPDMVAEGRRILLFSQFVTMLNLIEAELVKHGIEYVKLTGRTRDRQKVVQEFQTGKVPLFLISLKAGGVGLNLTAADTVIHYDPWWNPAVEDQATDRAHRIGQDQKVFVYKLLTENTIEQKVFELQQSKRGLVEGLLGGGGATQLSSKDFESLFEPLA